MTLLDFRKPKCVVVKQGVSASGKYKFFYGHHYTKGHTCYDVGTINQVTGEIISRHYFDDGKGNPKSNALTCYHNLEKGMLRKPDHEEKDDNDPRIADAFRRAITQRPGNS
jgi:hypothetical protein